MSEFDEIRRSKIVQHAVQAADNVIHDGAGKHADEIDFLMASVAIKLMQNVHSRLFTNLLANSVPKSSGPGR